MQGPIDQDGFAPSIQFEGHLGIVQLDYLSAHFMLLGKANGNHAAGFSTHRERRLMGELLAQRLMGLPGFGEIGATRQGYKHHQG